MSDHHPFSPSALFRLDACPGSYQLCKDLPEVSGDDADRGTAMHNYIAEPMARHNLSDADKATCDRVIDMFVKPFEGKADIFKEYRVSVKDESGAVLTEGTADFVAIAGNIACLNDWKFGANQVEDAETNLQMQGYAVGVMQLYPQITRLFAQVVQPMLGLSFDGQTCFDRSIIPVFIAKIKDIQKRCTAENAPFNAGEKQCRYCRGKNKCDAFKAWIIEHAEALAVKLPDYQLASVEQADNTLVKCNIVKKYLENMADAAKEIILQAGGSDNFCVVRESTTSKVDYKALCESLHPEPGIVEQFTSETTRGAFVTPRRKKK